MFLKTFLIVAVLLFSATIVYAHIPKFTCSVNADRTITCVGGFSDGSSAAGVAMRIETIDGRVLFSGQMNADSEFTFDRPRPGVDFIVIFDAGEGHVTQVLGKEIY